PKALAQFADQLQVHHRLRVLLAERADPVMQGVLREVRLLADGPRFSREVVARIKVLDGRRAPGWRPGVVWAAAVFAAVLGAVFFLPGRVPETEPPIVVALTSDVVLEREGRTVPLPVEAALRAGDGARIPEGGFLVARFPDGRGRLEAGPGRLTVLGKMDFRLHEGTFGAASPEVLETPHGRFRGASGWVALEIDASATRISVEGEGIRFVRADGFSVGVPAGHEARIEGAGEVVSVPFRREVLFVVGRTPLGPGDAAVRSRLEKELHATVIVRGAPEVSAAEAAGKTCVVISSTALAREVAEVAGGLRNKFRDIPVPVLTWEPRIFFDLGMIPGALHKADWAAARGGTHLRLSGLPHPLSAGLSGSVRVARERASFSWGRPRPDALRVAALEGAEDAWAIFAYDRGATMPGGAAPARRVGFFLFDDTAAVLTPEGWALFDAAMRWSVSGGP
ncbi:MAG: hypothetical protein ACK44W_13065, partial [Planctomycetota bacterium]